MNIDWPTALVLTTLMLILGVIALALIATMKK